MFKPSNIRKRCKRVVKLIVLLPLAALLNCAPDSGGDQQTYFMEYDSLDYASNIQFKGERTPDLNEKEVAQFFQAYFRQIELLDAMENTTQLKFGFYKFRGTFFKRLGLHNESNNNLKIAYDHFYQIPADSLTAHSVLHGHLGFADMAGNYMALNQVDSATVAYNGSLEYAKEYIPSGAGQAASLNNLGIHYLEDLKKPDSALYYFKRAEDLIRVENNLLYRSFMGEIKNNIANVYREQGNFEKARTIFTENFTFFHPEHYAAGPDYFVWLRSGLQTAECDLNLGEFNKALEELTRIEGLLRHYDFVRKPEVRLRLLGNFEDVYLAQEHYEQAYNYSRKKRFLNDSLERIRQAKGALWAATYRKMVLKNFEREAQSKLIVEDLRRSQVNKLLVLVVTALLLIGSVLTMLLLRRRQNLQHIERTKLIKEQDIRILELRNELLHRDMNVKNRDFSQLIYDLKLEYEWTLDMSKKLRSLRHLESKQRSQVLDELIQKVDTLLSEEESDQAFEQKIKELNEDFRQKLVEIAPAITDSEIKLSALIKRGINNSEIAALLNIKSGSILQKRYRLKKKFKLDKDQNLDFFLRNI